MAICIVYTYVGIVRSKNLKGKISNLMQLVKILPFKVFFPILFACKADKNSSKFQHQFFPNPQFIRNSAVKALCYMGKFTIGNVA